MDDDALRDEVLGRTGALAAIPAPLGEEAERAGLVAGWWRADGLAEVAVDAAGNVLGRLRDGSSGRALVLAAHLDTVFPRSLAHGVTRDGDTLRGPSAGDNSVAVAALSALRHLLPASSRDAVWLAATVGEEGLGNLRGATHLVASREDLAAFVAVEGVFGNRIALGGPGSVRATIEVTGPGGHSWIDRDRDSAVHGAGRAIARLDRERPGADQPWSWHVASIEGGGDVNVLASRASFVLEVRAPDQGELDAAQARARALIAVGVGAERGLAWSWTDLGRRPAGRLAEDHPLARAALAAHAEHGRAVEVADAGTDANAAHGAGVPALTVGITQGGGIHTPDEWISVAPIPTGLRVLASFVARVAG